MEWKTVPNIKGPTNGIINRITDSKFIEFFWNKSERSSNGCLEWTGYKDGRGYGMIRVSGKLFRAHRLSWMLSRNKDIPDEGCILHKCDNRLCIDPEHLYLGNQSDNNMDRAKRSPNNQGGVTSKLYSGEIWLIRKLFAEGISRKIISKMFKVHQWTISRICKSNKIKGKDQIYA